MQIIEALFLSLQIVCKVTWRTSLVLTLLDALAILIQLVRHRVRRHFLELGV